MIEHQLVLIIALILAICVLIMVSQRIKVAYPIMLVLGGVAMRAQRKISGGYA